MSIGYPPALHFLSDLGIEAQVGPGSDATARIRVTPHVTATDGGVRAGVLATLVDVVGGAVAARVLRPDWMATADLTLEVVRPAAGPFVEARATVVRRGRTTLVIEAGVFNVLDEGSDVTVGVEGLRPVGWATMTFAVLPGQSPTSNLEVPGELPDRWAFVGDGLDRPVVEALSISVVDAAEGRISMPVQDYLFNSFGAVQGGVMALLGEVAGAEVLGEAVGPGGNFVATDLRVAYLALGRVGPIVSRSRVLAAQDGGPHRSAVVELFDAGAGDRLTTVINVGAMPAAAAAMGSGW
ncbi:MAG TPA: PaaI family thioesterase [Acidimicrobiales bacterium]|nr:PaaI family thioesterase [Acidimicrobiales bacterium]